uniref:LAGLIDADG homing endonuclease n=1 Tax=Panagrolaimus sp. ES5 TaxID=591445 RepID=A0AC34F0S6_9BILA
MEIKLTPEFQSKVQSFLSKTNFKNCRHYSWLTNDTLNPSIIDDHRCFSEFEYGRVFFEIFKSSTLNSSLNGCNIDRVEIHPCYSYNNPSNIYWGVNDTRFNFNCSGTIALDGKPYLWLSITAPVLKHQIISKATHKALLNRIVSSTAFFFQCPTCTFMYRFPNASILPRNRLPGYSVYRAVQITPSIPRGAQVCYENWAAFCEIKKIPMILAAFRPFSQRVLPFAIVPEKYCF